MTAELTKRKSPSHITVQTILWVSLGSSGAIEIFRLLEAESLDLETATHGAQGPISSNGVTFERSFINRFSHPVCVAAI